MNRRDFLRRLAALPLLISVWPRMAWAKPSKRSRVRPTDPGWPSVAEWEKLKSQVGGRLIEVHSPLEACKTADKAEIDKVFSAIRNPYYISDEAALTQSTGFVEGWETRPSVYAIAAESTADIVAGVNFAREHNLRLVVKGGGHSYHGTSNASDSLLIWTHPMQKITMHDSFVPKGCEGHIAPQPAVTVEAGCIWMHVYNEVTTKHGRYVQGGGCATVGVAGLVQSGGFGSFSKNFGTAAASLLEAEVVTADGRVLTVNARTNPDLFLALKGGGGGNWGVVARLTLLTHDLPENFGGAFLKIKAASDQAFRSLLAKFVELYRDHLFNPHWGEVVVVGADNTLESKVLMQGLSQQEAQAVWQPFFDWLKGSPKTFTLLSPPIVISIPARHFWDPDFWAGYAPSAITADDRPSAPKENIFWSGDHDQCGLYWHGYESVWLPASLLKQENEQRLVDALFAASRWWDVELHFNKGLAGAPPGAISRSRETATNPAVLEAFALAIIAGGEGPAYTGVPGHEPNLERGRRRAGDIREAMIALRKVVPNPGSYVSESSYFEKDWHHCYWGPNYEKLTAVKKKFDPDGLFFVHNGVGSDEWSKDGFTRSG